MTASAAKQSFSGDGANGRNGSGPDPQQSEGITRVLPESSERELKID